MPHLNHLYRDEHMQILQRFCLVVSVGLWTVDRNLIEFLCEHVEALSVYLLLGVLSVSIIKLT